MKSHLLRTVLLASIGLIGALAPSGWARQNNQPAPSGTLTDEATIEVTRETAPPNIDDVAAFIDNSASQHAPAIVGMTADQLPRFFTRKLELEGPTLKISLSVNLPQEAQRPAAREYLDRVVRDTLNHLDSTRAASIERRLTGVKENVALAEKRYADEMQMARDLEKRLREASGRVDVSPQNLLNAITQLDEEHMRLEIEQAAKLARRGALTKALAESKKEIEQRVKEDPVVAELEKVLQIRVEALKRKREMAEQGLISKEELADAEAQIAEARAQLLDRRQQAAEQAGADVVNSWNRELLSLSVDENEMLARLEQVSQRLNRMRQLLDSLDQLKDLQERCEDTQRRLHDAQSRLEDTAARLREMAEQPDTSVTRPGQPLPTTRER